MLPGNNSITTPAVYNIPQAEPVRSLSLRINKISKKIETAKIVGNVYIIRREEKREVLTPDVSNKLADIAANMLLMNIENGEPAKALYFNDNIAPLIVELGYDNIQNLVKHNILPDDEQDIIYKDLLSGALIFYKEKLNGTVLPKVDSSIKESPFPKFTTEMKVRASVGMTTFDIANKLFLINGIGQSAPISASTASFDELLRLISGVYALEQNKKRYETLDTGSDTEIEGVRAEARALALKIGLTKILALLQVVQAKIPTVDETGENSNAYNKLELLNISDNLRRALRLIDNVKMHAAGGGLRITDKSRERLKLGEQGQQISLLLEDDL